MTTTTAAAVLPLNDAGWPVAGPREQAADPTSRGAERIRVLIADDHEVVRAGLRAFLDLDSALEVVGEAHGGREGVVVGGDEERECLGKSFEESLLLGVDREQPDPRHVMGPGILSDAG